MTPRLEALLHRWIDGGDLSLSKMEATLLPAQSAGPQ